MRVIVPSIEKAKPVGNTAMFFFCIISHSSCGGTRKLLLSDTPLGKWQALTFEFLISSIYFMHIQANLPNFSICTSWQVLHSLWLGSTPGFQTCQLIYWIRVILLTLTLCYPADWLLYSSLPALPWLCTSAILSPQLMMQSRRQRWVLQMVWCQLSGHGVLKSHAKWSLLSLLLLRSSLALWPFILTEGGKENGQQQ